MCFFFSSRRRHTRYWRDWSSDVCSSDLMGTHGTVLDAVPEIEGYPAVYACGPNAMLAAVKRAAGGGSVCQLSVVERMACGNGSCNGCVVPVHNGGHGRSFRARGVFCAVD